MSKESSTWRSLQLGRELTVARWGEVGTPLLLFPTAGGDAEESERFLMIRALAPFLEQRRLKVYGVDSVAARAWLDEDKSMEAGAAIQDRFMKAIVKEVVPAIRRDCNDPSIEIILAGSSIGAYNALASICRYPELFSAAICMSGTYDLSKFLEGEPTDTLKACSPLHFVAELSPNSSQLLKLRERFVLLTHGEGRWEEPRQSWLAAEVLGGQGIPNRVDAWDQSWDHDWPTWRAMLPKYLEELLPRAEAGVETGSGS